MPFLALSLSSFQRLLIEHHSDDSQLSVTGQSIIHYNYNQQHSIDLTNSQVSCKSIAVRRTTTSREGEGTATDSRFIKTKTLHVHKVGALNKLLQKSY